MATSPNFSWPEPDNTDLVKNGALAIRTAVDAIDASMVDLKGGTTGQVLSKTSNTDMDFTWVAQDDSNAIQNAIVDAKGDIIVATAADTPARLAVGANGTVLTADSAAATGLKWAAAGGGGKVLQVVHASTPTETASSSTTFATTSLTATITPSAASSKILVLVSQNGLLVDNTANQGIKLQLLRGATVISSITDKQSSNTGNQFILTAASFNWLDNPATTSATTYSTQFARSQASGTVYVQNAIATDKSVSTITLMEIGA
jgi:hypothetical protein